MLIERWVKPVMVCDGQLRTSWGKGDQVEIFSNTHQEWYMSEVVDIIKDDEGEWLNCVGEAMCKQVQRFSTEVRPPQGDDDDESGSPDAVSKSVKLDSLSVGDIIDVEDGDGK